MTPYSSLAYFVILAALVLALAGVSAGGRVTRHWITGGTVLMLVLQYAVPVNHDWEALQLECASLLAWGTMQTALLITVLRRPSFRGTARWSVPLGVLPLVIVKAGSAWVPGWSLGFDGISYVTFRVLDVLWCLSDGILTDVRVMDCLVFMFFFPTLSSGPIDRFRRFRDDWRRERSTAEFWSDVDAGIARIFQGLLYKFVIATLIDRHVLGHAGSVPGLPGALQYGFVWGLYLFFDFAGYSAFAVGAGRCFGIHVPGNFDAPFAATDIRDFWSRWHISLSTWFRDHIYMRFLMTARKRKWFARTGTASMAAAYLSFGTMGLWHGFSLNYITYGLYHATLLVTAENFTRWRHRHPGRFDTMWWRYTARLLTVLSVSFGFWIFSGHGWKEKAAGTPGFLSDRFTGNRHHKSSRTSE